MNVNFFSNINFNFPNDNKGIFLTVFIAVSVLIVVLVAVS